MIRIFIAAVTLALPSLVSATSWENGMTPTKYELSQLLESRRSQPNYENLWEYSPQYNTHKNEFDRRQMKQNFIATIDKELAAAKDVHHIELVTKVRLDEYDFERKGFALIRDIGSLGYGKYNVNLINSEWVNFIYVKEALVTSIADSFDRTGFGRKAEIKLGIVIAKELNPQGRSNDLSINGEVRYLTATHLKSKTVLSNYRIPEEK